MSSSEKIFLKKGNLAEQMPEVVTFGCRLNAFESEVIKDLSAKTGLREAIIFNTCAVTAEAERQARQAIRKMHRQHPNKKIIVTGCAAQIRPDSFLGIEGVTHVVGNHDKMQPKTFEDILHKRTEKPASQVTDIMEVKEAANQVVTSFDGKARAYVEIQNGCNHRCTFCTIPFGRGNNRSAPVAQIVKQIQLFVDKGYKEIVLTGVDITDYGKDLPGNPCLGDLVRRILSNTPKLQRLRLSSLDPVEIDPVLFDLIEGEQRLLPHFHLSVQAGDTMILKRMKRRHIREDILACADEIYKRRPNATLGADVIAGFPTETEQMFQTTYDLIKEVKFRFLHVFPYSPRPGTPASRMPQVAGHVIKKRAYLLRELGERLRSDYYDGCVGFVKKALVERPRVARTDTYGQIALDVDQTPGEIIKVQVTGKKGSKEMQGEVI